MIRKTEEVEKTISGLVKTIFDWDNLNLIEEAQELLSNIFEPEIQRAPKWTGEGLRVNKFGEIIHPPIKPEPIDQTGWKRITPKRSAMLQQYKVDKAQYDIDMEEWLQLPLLNDGRTALEHRIEFLRNRPFIDHGINKRAYYDYMNGVFDPEIPVLKYWVRGFGEVRITAFPVRHTQLVVVDCDPTNNYWTQMGFEGNASHERRHYKRNRSIPKEDWADTDLETGEQLQRTLFDFTEVRGYNPNPRIVVSYDLFESFETKPNSYLSKAYLDYLLNGTPLTDWQKFQLNKRMTKTVSVKEGQQTLL